MLKKAATSRGWDGSERLLLEGDDLDATFESRPTLQQLAAENGIIDLEMSVYREVDISPRCGFCEIALQTVVARQAGMYGVRRRTDNSGVQLGY